MVNQYFRRLLRSPGAGWSSPVSNASRFLCLCMAWVRFLSVGGSHPSLAGRGGVVRAAEEDGGSERAGEGSYGDVPGHVSMWHYSMPRGVCACIDCPSLGRRTGKRLVDNEKSSPLSMSSLPVCSEDGHLSQTRTVSRPSSGDVPTTTSSRCGCGRRLWPRSEWRRRGSTCFSHQDPPPPSFFKSVNF